jgi:hypothetical protein
MTIDDVALRVADALNAAGVPFMLVGGFSSNYHGIPRSTKDWPYIEGWSDRHGTRELLEQIRRTVPKV